MQTLQNLTALMVYANTGTGRAIAERYAAMSAKVILHFDSDGTVDQQLILNIQAMGTKVSSVSTRLSSENELQQLFFKLGTQNKNPDIIAIHDNAVVFDLNMLRKTVDQISDHGRLIYLAPVNEQPDLKRIAGWVGQLAHENASRDTTVNAVLIPPDSLTVLTRRLEETEDIADAAEFFASDLANLITGQYLLLNANPDFF